MKPPVLMPRPLWLLWLPLLSPKTLKPLLLVLVLLLPVVRAADAPPTPWLLSRL